MEPKSKITLEPILEERAVDWSASKCRLMAALYERWARQLRIRAAILDRDASPKPAPHLKILPIRKSRLN